jgi:ABC-type proline/glycine betaine transport system ATPase subunit
MVTHDPRSLDLADRIVTLEDGAVAATQRPLRLMATTCVAGMNRSVPRDSVDTRQADTPSEKSGKASRSMAASLSRCRLTGVLR